MNFQRIIQHLKEGGVMAYPTETLWGLGADIYNDKAVEKIFEIKSRDDSKAISVLVSDIYMAKELAVVDKRLEELMQIFWPGPVTFVVEAKDKVSKLLHGGTGFIGLRCSAHPWVKEFLLNYQSPLTTTSVNRSGEAPARSKEDLSWLNDDVVLVDWQGPEGNKDSLGSTVVKYSQTKLELLRQGDVPFDLLQQAK